MTIDLNKIVTIEITSLAAGVTVADFGVPLIAAYHNNTAEVVKSYTDAFQLIDDGFTTNSPAFVAALALQSQVNAPPVFKVGKLDPTGITQTFIITPTPLATATYTVSVNGVTASFKADTTPTAAEIVTGLTNALNTTLDSSTLALLTLSGTTTLNIQTAADADIVVSGFSNNLSVDFFSSDSNGASKLNQIIAADSDWYVLLPAIIPDSVQTEFAPIIESLDKIALYATFDTSVLDTGSTSDIAATLNSQQRNRAAVCYHPFPNEAINAAWAGRMLSFSPGEATWNLKTLSGVQGRSYNATQLTALTNKNCNYYEGDAQLALTQTGVISGGNFVYIDITRLRDWTKARIEEELYTYLFNTPKPPLTDAGLGQIQTRIQNILDIGVANGGFDPESISVSVPEVSTISSADRQAGRITSTFTATASGAIHTFNIQGFISL